MKLGHERQLSGKVATDGFWPKADLLANVTRQIFIFGLTSLL